MGIARWIVVFGLALMACDASYPPIIKVQTGETSGRACVFYDNLKWRQFGKTGTIADLGTVGAIEVNMPRLTAELLVIAFGTGLVAAIAASRCRDV